MFTHSVCSVSWSSLGAQTHGQHGSYFLAVVLQHFSCSVSRVHSFFCGVHSYWLQYGQEALAGQGGWGGRQDLDAPWTMGLNSWFYMCKTDILRYPPPNHFVLFIFVCFSFVRWGRDFWVKSSCSQGPFLALCSEVTPVLRDKCKAWNGIKFGCIHAKCLISKLSRQSLYLKKNL